MFVNHELFVFADASTRERFRKDPLRYCGILTDPVSKVRFRPTARAPRTEYDGRLYFFTEPGTLARFTAHPDSFAFRKGV